MTALERLARRICFFDFGGYAAKPRRTEKDIWDSLEPVTREHYARTARFFASMTFKLSARHYDWDILVEAQREVQR